MKHLDLIATATFGMESQVAYELKQLGYDDQHVEGGRVTFRGDMAAIARTNIWLRVADRVLLRVGEFPARTFDELYDRTRALPWADLIALDGAIPVDGKSVKSQLSSVPAVQGVVKKAIVDALAERHHVQTLPETGARYRVLVALLDDVATLTLDTSGDGLHKRGYRQLAATAPIKETLAAGLISLSRWRPEQPFADPLCGSGTLPIEAAMQALNIAPGARRRFDAEGWDCVGEKVWTDARREADDLACMDRAIDIEGTDISENVLALARHHAYLMGLERHIRFACKPVKDWRPSAEYGAIITNPPYGERMGDAAEVERLYKDMGEAFLGHSTWSFFVLTAYERFERPFGRPAARKRKLYNGRLRCDFFQYPGPRPPRITPPVI